MSSFLDIDDPDAVRGIGGRIVGRAMELDGAISSRLATIAELEAGDPFGADKYGEAAKARYSDGGVPPAEALRLREVPAPLLGLGTDIIDAMGTYESADADAEARFRAMGQR
jgi:hypothetical protein